MIALVAAAYPVTWWAMIDAWARGRDVWCVVFIAGLLALSMSYTQLVRLRNIAR